VSAWEKKFNIEPTVQNGEKTYTDEHLATFRSVKELLYEKGLSMDAAKKYMYDRSELEGSTLQAASTLIFAAAKAQKPTQPNEAEKQYTQRLLSIKERLVKLRNSLES
jgi:DNA-binding transcriptional MerR regulator